MSAQTPQTNSPFIYMLNAFERASQSDNPSEQGYAVKRQHTLGYVASLEADRDHHKALCEELREALDHILWIKDCGIDGKNEKGEFVNWPADERNAMYEIAKAALKKAQKDI